MSDEGVVEYRSRACRLRGKRSHETLVVFALENEIFTGYQDSGHLP